MIVICQTKKNKTKKIFTKIQAFKSIKIVTLVWPQVYQIQQLVSEQPERNGEYSIGMLQACKDNPEYSPKGSAT